MRMQRRAPPPALLLLIGFLFSVSSFSLRMHGGYRSHTRPEQRAKKKLATRPMRDKSLLNGDSFVSLRNGVQDSNETQGSRSKRSPLLTVAVSALAATTGAAKLGLLYGPVMPDGSFGPYSDALILRDVGAAVLTAVLGYAYVTLNTIAVDRGILEPRDSRKLIHTFSAPLFILFWPIFSDATGARAFCAIVPALNAVRLFAAASGEGETSLANAVSRSGDSKEALGGPFIYVCILATCILAFWRDSVVGITAVSALAAGDGLADLIGRRFGKGNQWPGLDKSVAGTVAFWSGATVCTVGLLLWMQYCDCLTLAFLGQDLVVRVASIILVTALIELVPSVDDNYTVPATAAILAMLFLQ
jgi:phytol kinase